LVRFPNRLGSVSENIGQISDIENSKFADLTCEK